MQDGSKLSKIKISILGNQHITFYQLIKSFPKRKTFQNFITLLFAQYDPNAYLCHINKILYNIITTP